MVDAGLSGPDRNRISGIDHQVFSHLQGVVLADRAAAVLSYAQRMILPDRLRPIGSDLLGEAGTNRNIPALADLLAQTGADSDTLIPADGYGLLTTHIDRFVDSDITGTGLGNADNLVGTDGFSSISADGDGLVVAHLLGPVSTDVTSRLRSFSTCSRRSCSMVLSLSN